MVDWPSAAELAQVLNLNPEEDHWEDLLDRAIAAGIASVKNDVGNWNETDDAPDEALAQAALRYAELIATRPDTPNSRDTTYMRLLKGHRRRFGIA